MGVVDRQQYIDITNQGAHKHQRNRYTAEELTFDAASNQMSAQHVRQTNLESAKTNSGFGWGTLQPQGQGK